MTWMKLIKYALYTKSLLQKSRKLSVSNWTLFLPNCKPKSMSVLSMPAGIIMDLSGPQIFQHKPLTRDYQLLPCLPIFWLISLQTDAFLILTIYLVRTLRAGRKLRKLVVRDISAENLLMSLPLIPTLSFRSFSR